MFQTNLAHRSPCPLSQFRVCQIVTAMGVLGGVDRILSRQENAMTRIGVDEKHYRTTSVGPPLSKRSSKDIGRPERVGASRYQNNIGPRRLNVNRRRFNVAAESDQALLNVAAIRRQAVDRDDRRREVITHEGQRLALISPGRSQWQSKAVSTNAAVCPDH